MPSSGHITSLRGDLSKEEREFANAAAGTLGRVEGDDLAAFHGPVPRPTSGSGGIGMPKRARALDAPAATKKEIREAKCRECRLCGETRNVQPHHLVPRGMGGTIGGEWVPANIVGLCGHGNVDGCHGLVEKHDPDACHVLRTLLHPSEIAYIVEKKGQAWLDGRYPLAVTQ